LLNVVKPERPAVPRSYPYDGLNAELGGLEENKVSSTILRPLSANLKPSNRPFPTQKTMRNSLQLFIVAIQNYNDTCLGRIFVTRRT